MIHRQTKRMTLVSDRGQKNKEPIARQLNAHLIISINRIYIKAKSFNVAQVKWQQKSVQFKKKDKADQSGVAVPRQLRKLVKSRKWDSQIIIKSCI